MIRELVNDRDVPLASQCQIRILVIVVTHWQ